MAQRCLATTAAQQMEQTQAVAAVESPQIHSTHQPRRTVAAAYIARYNTAFPGTTALCVVCCVSPPAWAMLQLLTRCLAKTAAQLTDHTKAVTAGDSPLIHSSHQLKGYNCLRLIPQMTLHGITGFSVICCVSAPDRDKLLQLIRRLPRTAAQQTEQTKAVTSAYSPQPHSTQQLRSTTACRLHVRTQHKTAWQH